MPEQIHHQQKHWFICLAVLFKAILDWSYLLLSKSAFSNEYVFDISWLKLIFSYLAVIVMSLFTSFSRKTSVFLFRIIIFFTLIPLSTVYAMRNESSVFYFLTIGSFVLVELLLLYHPGYICTSSKTEGWQTIRSTVHEEQDCMPTKSVALISTVSNCSSLFCILAAGITVFLLFHYNGIPSFRTLQLNNVYSVRAAYQTTKYLGYLTSLTSYVLVPFGIAKGMSQKKAGKVLFWFAIQFLLFLWTGHKTWLFSIALIAGVMLMVKKVISERTFFLLIIFVVLFGCITFQSSNAFRYVFSLFNRRVLLNSASLKYFYYDYFVKKGNQLIGVAGTVLAPFFPHKGIDVPYAEIISLQYTGVISNANTGLYGGDFANIGVMVFAATPLLLVLFDKMVSHCSRKCGTDFASILFVYLAFSLNDQGLFQFFLDFKGIVLILLVCIYRMSYHYKRFNQQCLAKTIS